MQNVNNVVNMSCPHYYIVRETFYDINVPESSNSPGKNCELHMQCINNN